jgi:cytochrome P450
MGLRSRRRQREITEVDLTDPRTFTTHDLTEYWVRMRAEYPVRWHPPAGGNPGFWVISRYADVSAVLRDPARFTSERGNVLVTLLAGGDSAAGRMLPVTDGKRHTKLRGIMLKAFSPRALSQVAERVRANARAILSEAVYEGEVEFAQRVAAPIPCTTICDLLGVPQVDRADVLHWSSSSLSSADERQSPADALLARNELLRYFTDLVEDKQSHPTDDVISVLVQTEVDNSKLSTQDIAYNCYSLILGGDETSRLAMIDAVLTLTRNPDQWCRLRTGEVPVEVATEEVLRWSTPAMNFGRTTMVDVEIAGQEIRAGESVTLWNTSANRDETVFPAAHEFDLSRTPNKHLTFGHGPHFCLGAYLARVEIRELLDALRTYCDDFEVTGEPRRIHSNFMTGMSHLPVRFHPAIEG